MRENSVRGLLSKLSGMQIEQDSRLTRKLFLMFVLFALLPTLVLSVVAVNYLASEAEKQARETMEHQLDYFSQEVFNRLEFTRQDFESGDTVSIYDTQLYDFGDSSTPFPALSPLQKQRLRSGKSQLVSADDGEGLPQQYLLRAVEPAAESEVVSAMALDESMVFGETGSWDLSLESCIFDERGRLIYTTRATLCERTEVLGSQSQSGSHLFHYLGTDYIASYQPLRLKHHYGSRYWTIVLAKPSADVFSALKLFQSKFLALAGTLILAMSLLNIVFIRRHMSPLGPIMDAIRRTGNREYGQTVEVSSGDEFEELAETFNTMSNQVARQLRTQASMSSIDQLILSRVKKEDIIRIVLEKTGEVLPSDSLSVLLMDDESSGRVYRPDQLPMGNDRVRSITLEADILDRLEAADCHPIPRGRERADWLDTLRLYHCRYLQLLPVKTNDKLIAIICLGYIKRPQLNEDSRALALSYTNRIAVALSNAEWEDRLYQQAHYDSLTGLPNRPSMIDRLQQSIDVATREESSFAVMFVDLDDFKLINDSLGHSTGDALIQSLAHRLQDILRAEDTVARLGGDEFVIISGHSPSHKQAADTARHIAEKIQASVNQSIQIDGHEIRASTSIGIALYPSDGEASETLLKNADTAMYHSKGRGQGDFQFYSDKLNAESLALLKLGTDINNALDQGQFELYYQPKVNLDNYQIVGAEALIRWHHPREGFILPEAFIEQAEQLGLIKRLGEWVLENTCKQLARWKRYYPQLRVSVNLSALQMRDVDVYDHIVTLMQSYDIPGHMLELEITEGVLLEDADSITATLEKLRALDVHISIDDYGTGYSSLSYMKRLPADTLKIDREFIVNLADNNADQAIVHSTITLAHDLGMRVIAEGVDDRRQLEFLKNFGCDELQGFLFSAPVPAADFFRQLRQGLPSIAQPEHRPKIVTSSAALRT